MSRRGARIAGLGEARPARVVSNDDLAETLDTNDAWIRQRTGIRVRHVAGDGESVVDLGAVAAGKALAASGISASDVDLVVLASCSLPSPIPGGAASVAHRVGASKAGAFDLNAACAGFCYALSVAADAVRVGSASTALVVASERMSDWIDWTDRSTAIIFGDGAGAAVVASAREDEIGPVVWGSDGSGAAAIEAPRGGHIRMDGSGVFRWATGAMVEVAERACAVAGIKPGDLAAFVPHQANLRIVEALARALGVPDDRVARDVVETGNTSSASVPLALARLVAERRVAPGEPVLLLGFGAGLTYAGQVVRCP